MSSPQTPSSAADAALPETVEQALRWFAHIGDPSGNDDAVALPTSEKLEQCVPDSPLGRVLPWV